MGHGIITEGQRMDTVLIVGDKGWHGLAQDRQSITAGDVREVFLPNDWTMEEAFIGSGAKIDGKMAVVSGGVPVGIVGEGYTMLTMDDVLSFAESICLAHGTGKIVSAGTLHGREDFFLDLGIDKEFRNGDDVTKPYIALSNNAVGLRHFEAGAHTTRIVCANTLRLAIGELRGSPRAVKIRHSKSAHDRLREANRVLGLSMAAFDAADAEMHAMIGMELNEAGVNAYYDRVKPIQSIPASADEEEADKIERANRKAAKIREEWWEILNRERLTLRVADPNLWLAMNSVTNWAQKTRTVRGESTDPMLRLWSNRFGDGATSTDEAHDAAVEMLTA